MPYLYRFTPIFAILSLAASAQLPEPKTKANLSSQLRIDDSPSTVQGTRGLDEEDLVDRVRDSVVTVHAIYEDLDAKIKTSTDSSDLIPDDERGDDQTNGNASGLIISSGGWIITHTWAVHRAESLIVRTRDSKRDLPAIVAGIDKDTGIALLKVEGERLEPALLGDSSHTRTGDSVLAIGGTYGLARVVSRDRLIGCDYGAFIQTANILDSENFGGPLVDREGRVIGINIGYSSEQENLAVPINLAIRIAQDLHDHGGVLRGLLGAYFSKVTPELIGRFDLPKHAIGLLVSNLESGQAAEKAGLQAGDLVYEVNGHPIKQNFRFQLAAFKPNEKVSLKVFRKSKSLDFTVVARGPLQSGDSHSHTKDVPKSAELSSGLFVAEIDHGWKQRLQLQSIVKGLVVTQDLKEKDGSNLIKTGDLLLKINGKEIKTVEKAREHIGSLETSVLMLVVRRGGKDRFVAVPRDM